MKKMAVDILPEGFKNSYPFKEGEVILFMGEIENMPGHCIIALQDGRVLWGYHTENFRELREEELGVTITI